MTDSSEIWVERANLRRCKSVTVSLPPAGEGEVLVAIDKFGLTSNNVSYGLSGDMIGYWKYFPAQEEWGKVPVWGIGEIIESGVPGIEVGERIWGFFPMASHVLLQPGNIRTDQFTDVREHRRELPALYNHYRRTSAEPAFLSEMEDERCLLFPLFATSYVLYDYLKHHDCFGAAQVLIGSASSKTGLGLGWLLHRDPAVKQRVVALTSASNLDFVESLDIADQVLAYGDESQLDAAVPAAWVDMSGDAALTATVHNLFGEQLVESCAVGATHWEAGGAHRDLPGATPTFFFAPAYIGQRDAELGAGVMMTRAMEASAEIARSIASGLTIERIKGADTLLGIWRDMLENRVSPSRGLMVSLLP
jgi:hypothetical protein